MMESFGWTGLVMLGLFVFGIVSYFVVMFIWPEWVGISGKDSKKTMESHREDAPKAVVTDRLGDFLSGKSPQTDSETSRTPKNSRNS